MEPEIIGGYVPVSDELMFDVFPDPWTYPGVGVDISPDPLGPVNKIFQLYRVDGEGTKVPIGAAKLYPLREGQAVEFGERGSDWLEMFGPSWSNQLGDPNPRVWYVSIDEKTIIEVPYSAAFPPVPAPTSVPLRRRIRTLVDSWRRSSVDRLAERVGYQRIGECECDEY